MLNLPRFKTSFRQSASRTRTALTLLELLVVLVILAIVATVAVNSLQPRVESARFEQTQRQLNQVTDAILGPRQARLPDGTPMVTGFVADIGRLPVIQNSTNDFDQETGNRIDGGGRELSELWSDQSGLAETYPFQFRSGPQSPVDYSDVQLPCGWRSPYLHLPMGLNSLRDPWNRPFEVVTSSDGQVQSIVWNPIGSFSEPLINDVKNGMVTVTGAINFGQTVPSNIEITMLAPNPESSRTELVILADEDESPNTFSFSSVPIGLRAICITVESQRLMTKYVQVPHTGLSLVFDLAQELPQLQSSASNE